MAWEQPMALAVFLVIPFFLHGKRKSPNTTGLPFIGTAISVPTVILWIRYNLHLLPYLSQLPFLALLL